MASAIVKLMNERVAALNTSSRSFILATFTTLMALGTFALAQRSALLPFSTSWQADLQAASVGCLLCVVNIEAWAAMFRCFVADKTKTASKRKNFLLLIMLKSTVVGAVLYGVLAATRNELESALLGFTVCLLFGSLFTALAQRHPKDRRFPEP